MRLASAIFAAMLLAATPAQAEVTAKADNGFAVSHKVTVSVDPEAAFAMVRTPAKWWAKEHSWTGNSDNFYMDAQAGGCFCELIPNAATTESGAPQRTLRGSVQHMQILYVDPGRLLRLSGALGPLQSEAMTGTLTISFADIKGGTEMTFDYVVAGFMRTPVDQMAPVVDGMIGEQASRLAMALGPLVGGGGKLKPKPEPKLEPKDVREAEPAEANDTPDAAETGDKDSVSNLVADLEPDEDVSGGAPEAMLDAASASASDRLVADVEPDAKPMAKPRTKPGTRPLTRRAPSGEKASEPNPDTGR